MRKKVCAPAHIDTAGAAALKTMRLHECLRRHDITQLSTATAMVAGAGPNSRANAMKNVSEIEMVATTDAILIVKEPATIARTAKRTHSTGRGVRATPTKERRMTTAPMDTTTCRYSRSAPDGARRADRPPLEGTASLIRSLQIERRQHRIGPDDLVVIRRAGVGPDDLLPQRIEEGVAPIDHVLVRV